MTGRRILPCPACGGDRGWDVPYDINRFDGSLITHWRECGACDENGDIEIEDEPVSMEDLDELEEVIW